MISQSSPTEKKVGKVMQVVELSTIYRVGLDIASPKFSRRFPDNQGTGAHKEGVKC